MNLSYAREDRKKLNRKARGQSDSKKTENKPQSTVKQILLFSDKSVPTKNTDNNTKRCRYCKKTKPLSEFDKHCHNSDNLDTRCKKCRTKIFDIQRELHKTAPKKPPVCDLCGKEPRLASGELRHYLDHDHKTHKFRGWLCNRCNTGLGCLGDNIDGIKNALEYLERTL